MENEISFVNQILIPLEQYPHLHEDKPIGDAVALLLQNESADGRHLHFDELLVIDKDGRLVGHIFIHDILTSFFPSILGTSTNGIYAGKKEHFTDLSILLEDSFRRECRRQAAHTVKMHMTKPHRSVDGSMTLLHALEIMVKDGETTLPVTENNLLIGAIRMQDIFKVLGNYCTI